MYLPFHYHYSSDRSSRIGLASHVFLVLLVATELNRLHAKDNEVLTRSSTGGSSDHRRLDVSKGLQRFTVNRPTKKQRKFEKTESAYNFQKGQSVSSEIILNRSLEAKKTGNIRVTCSFPYSKAGKKCKIESSDLVSISELNYDDREITQKIEKNKTLSHRMEFGQRNTSGKIQKLTKKYYIFNDKVLGKREITAKVIDKTRKLIVILPNMEILIDGIIHDFPFQKDVDDHQLGTFKLQLETSIFKQNRSSDYEMNIKVLATRYRHQFEFKSVIILKSTQETKEQKRNNSEIGHGPKKSLFQIDKPIFIETEIAPNIINSLEIKQKELHDSSQNLGKQKILNENNRQINKTILTVIYNLTWIIAQPEETTPFIYIRKDPVDKIIPIIEKSVVDQEKTFTNVQCVPTTQSKLGSDVIKDDQITESNLKVTLQPEGPDELDKTTNFEIDITGHNDTVQNGVCPNCTIYTNTGYKNEENDSADTAQALDATASKPVSRPDLTAGGRKIAISAMPQKTDGEENGETWKTDPHVKTYTTKIYRFTPSRITKVTGVTQEKSAEIEEGKRKTEIPVSICNECPNEEKYWSAKVLKKISPFPYGVDSDFLTNNPDDRPALPHTTEPYSRPFISLRIPKRPATNNERLTSTGQPNNKKALFANNIDVVRPTKLPQSTSIKLRLTTINPNEFIFLGVMPHQRNRSKMAKYSRQSKSYIYSMYKNK